MGLNVKKKKEKKKGSVAIARISKDSSSEFESLLLLTSSVLKIGHVGQLFFPSLIAMYSHGSEHYFQHLAVVHGIV